MPALHEIAQTSCPQCGSNRWIVESLLSGFDLIALDQVPVVSLTASNKQELLREMLSALVESHEQLVPQHEAIFESLTTREELGPTGIGRGVAMPHAKLPDGESLLLAIGLSQQGVEYDSLDGQPVHIATMLISPADKPRDHLRAMECISLHLREFG